MSLVSPSLVYFPDPTKGRPVFYGQIYVGEPDLDPQIPANRKQATLRLEDGSLVDVGQPVLTGPGGTVLYQGSYAVLTTDGDFSLKVLDRNNDQIYYIPSNENIFDASQIGITIEGSNTNLQNYLENRQVADYAELRAIVSTDPAEGVIDGTVITVTDDGIAGEFVVKTGTVTDNGGTIIVFDDDANRYGARIGVKEYNVEWFGADRTGVVDASSAINMALQAGGTDSVVTGTTGAVYLVQDPIVLEYRNQTFDGNGAKIDASSFNISGNMAVIEALTRKNSVNLRSSREFIIIRNWQIIGNSSSPQQIAGIAASGFVRGSMIENNTVRYFYNCCQISGSFTFIVRNNLFRDATNVALMLGSDILMDVDGATYTDGGVNPILVQEGYEYDPGEISIQCNAVEIYGNTMRTSNDNLGVHFGNAINIWGNTLESADNLGLKITAMESGEITGNYNEANEGWLLGRDSNGAVQNVSITGNFLNSTDLYFPGFFLCEFRSNELAGSTAVVERGAYQRNYGNVTDLPNPTNRADVGFMQNSYTFQRDDEIQRDDSNYVAHHGLFKTCLDGSFIESGLTPTDQNNSGEPVAEITANCPVSDQATGTRLVVGTVATHIASASRGGMFIVFGENDVSSSTRFIDILICIGFGATSVVSSVVRGTPDARTYNMNGSDLELSMAADDYKISVRAFNFLNLDVPTT